MAAENGGSCPIGGPIDIAKVEERTCMALQASRGLRYQLEPGIKEGNG
jgi:hypothetical protein